VVSWGGNHGLGIWNRLFLMLGSGKKAETSKTINHGIHGIHGRKAVKSLKVTDSKWSGLLPCGQYVPW